MTATTTAQLSLRGVGRRYGEGRTAVDALADVDLAIEPGRLVVLLGPSGSGKTTLLNIIGGIEAPTAGTVESCGYDLAALDETGRTAYRRDRVGFVFQFFNLVPTLTAAENVELVGELTGVDEPAARARRTLAAVGLADRADNFPGQLSGGEQQRVAIARAVTKDPALLLCDEPTGALDTDTGRHVLVLLTRLAREEGRTVLVVTHNAAIAEVANRVVRLRSGRIVDDRENAVPRPADQVTW